MKILCVCPIGVGNYLLCYPAFILLKRSAPDASLHLLALREGIADIARNDSLWDNITVFDPTRMTRSILAPLRIVASLRKQHFHASLNFFPSNTWQYHLLPWLAGVRQRYAFAYRVSGLSKLSFLSNHTTPVNFDLHDVQQNYNLVALYLGNKRGNVQRVFPALFTEPDLQWARTYLTSLSSNSIRIGIHAGSSAEHGMEAKRWPPEKFAGLADNVCMLLKGEAFIFGGAEEEVLKKQVAHAMKLKAHVIQPISLSKTAALLSQCALCLCNDSGLMHMAACAGVATVGIFGPTDEKRNGPCGAETLVIRKKMDGFPVWTAFNVGKRSLPSGVDPQASLKALSVEDAWTQLEPWLKKVFNVGT